MTTELLPQVDLRLGDSKSAIVDVKIAKVEVDTLKAAMEIAQAKADEIKTRLYALGSPWTAYAHWTADRIKVTGTEGQGAFITFVGRGALQRLFASTGVLDTHMPAKLQGLLNQFLSSIIRR